jgi:hypothetical protein
LQDTRPREASRLPSMRASCARHGRPIGKAALQITIRFRWGPNSILGRVIRQSRLWDNTQLACCDLPLFRAGDECVRGLAPEGPGRRQWKPRPVRSGFCRCAGLGVLDAPMPGPPARTRPRGYRLSRYGTSATTVLGRNSSAPFTSSAVWLYSTCCHHRRGSYLLTEPGVGYRLATE